MSITPTFIDNNPEAILQEMLSFYENQRGSATNPSDPDRLLIDVMAYRETLLRAGMQRLIEGNFVQTATGDILDFWGEIFDVIRLADETDDSYRLRILSLNKTNSRGGKYIYEKTIRSLDATADIRIHSLWDDSSLAPGTIQIVPLMKLVDEDNDIIYGTLPNQAYKDAIIDALQNEDIGIIGDVFSFRNPTPVLIGTANIDAININYTSARTEADVRAEANKIIDAYFNELSLVINGKFNAVRLSNLLRSIEGVFVAEISVTAPIIDESSFYVKGDIAINMTT